MSWPKSKQPAAPSIHGFLDVFTLNDDPDLLTFTGGIADSRRNQHTRSASAGPDSYPNACTYSHRDSDFCSDAHRHTDSRTDSDPNAGFG